MAGTFGSAYHHLFETRTGPQLGSVSVKSGRGDCRFQSYRTCANAAGTLAFLGEVAKNP